MNRQRCDVKMPKKTWPSIASSIERKKYLEGFPLSLRPRALHKLATSVASAFNGDLSEWISRISNLISAAGADDVCFLNFFYFLFLLVSYMAAVEPFKSLKRNCQAKIVIYTYISIKFTAFCAAKNRQLFSEQSVNREQFQLLLFSSVVTEVPPKKKIYKTTKKGKK